MREAKDVGGKEGGEWGKEGVGGGSLIVCGAEVAHVTRDFLDVLMSS